MPPVAAAAARGAMAAAGSKEKKPKPRPSLLMLGSTASLFSESDVMLPWFWKYQSKARKFYRKTEVEVFVAALIGGNFLTNIVEATIDPAKNDSSGAFAGFEFFFNIAFTLELGVNMYGFWFFDFWKSSWNVFDFVVVSIGLLTTFQVPLPGPLKMLRMMRAFRVFRLFKRIKSLNKIMVSLAKAVPGVINAFVILILVMCIYAILAVELFQTQGAGGKIRNEAGQDIELTTARGQDYGFEYFGNFGKSIYTLFQVMTGDSWSEAVARPLMHGPNTLNNTLHGFFFVSFQILCATILINVVVAVLLEKMVDNEPPPPTDEAVDDGDGENSEADDQAGTPGLQEEGGGGNGTVVDNHEELRDAARQPEACNPNVPTEEIDQQRLDQVKSIDERKQVKKNKSSTKFSIAKLEAEMATMKADMEQIKDQVSKILGCLAQQA